MTEFVVFAVATSMCVLCFAVGFIAALNLRMAERTAVPVTGAPSRIGDAALPQSDPRPIVATTPFAPAPAAPAPAVSRPQAERTFDPQPVVSTRPMAPAPPPLRPHAVQPIAFPPPASPPAKVFLFGDPPVEPAVMPAVSPVHAASQPSPWVTTQNTPPQRLATAEVELLPHRPRQYARSARRR